ncbi:MAG TPA: hypothetical protein VFF79_05890 [Conexibacter sp.]|nr:hypothetical protein [Conexibacter sp.]
MEGEEATATLAHDLVVVLPGVMGSTLVRDGCEVWGPSAGSVLRAIRSFGASVRDLTLAPEIGDGDPCDGVCAARLMPDLHVVPGLWSVSLGYDRLLRRLRDILRVKGDPPSEADGDPPGLLAVPYDWRLSNRLNGQRLKTIVEPALERLRDRGGQFSEARITFVCHSMGGLVARWYVEREEGWRITRKLITIGTPHRGAAKSLHELVNGVSKGFGPLAVDLTAFARSLPSAYQLLPTYACVASGGSLRKLTETTVPNLDARLIADGAAFHADISAAASGRSAAPVDLRPIVGIKQPTITTATIASDVAQAIETIAGADERGDATVPRLAATPEEMAPDSSAIHWVAARHGALHRDDAVLDQLEGILTAQPIVHRGPALRPIGVRLPDLVLAGEEVEVEAELEGEGQVPLMVDVTDEQHRCVDQARLAVVGNVYRGRLRPLKPGGYVVTVGGYGAAVADVSAVASPLVVWEG